MSKKVVVFSLAYEPFVGGAEIAVKEIVRRNSDCDFTILTKKFDRSWANRESGGNYSLLRLGGGRTGKNYYGNFFGKIAYVWQSWRTAEKLHIKQPFSAIWAVMASYAGIAALLFKMRHPKVPFLLTLQEGDPETHILSRVGPFYLFWKKIFLNADFIQVISRYLADFARRHGALCPVEVVPNGVDIRAYEGTKKYESTKNAVTIITTSRLVHKNGVDILIKSLPLLRTTAYKLLILGDGPEKEKLKDLAVKLGVADKIEFLGHMDPDKIPHYLLQSTIFVRASRSEGLGNSFLEAMAAGLPVIGTAVGGIPDFLKDGETGLFCRSEDPRDLAGKIDLLINDNSLRGRLGHSGRELVLRDYSWDIVAKKMSDIFNSLVQRLKI